MDSSQARDHLDSVATILRTADRSLHVQPWIFVVWGLFAAAINALNQARLAGIGLPGDAAIQIAMILAAIAATVWLSVRTARGRETLMDRYAGVVFSVVLAVLLVANLAAQHRVVPYEGMALFWSFGLAMALLIVGIEASRTVLLGGLALIAASVAACFVPGWLNGLLAVGWLAGMVAPGLVLAWRRPGGSRPSERSARSDG